MLPKCTMGIYDKESINIAYHDCIRWKIYQRKNQAQQKQIKNKIKTISILKSMIELEQGELLSPKQKTLVSLNWKGGYTQFRVDNNDCSITVKLNMIQSTLSRFI